VSDGYTDPEGRFRPITPRTSSKSVAGAAVAVVLSALAGGGAGGAAAASGAAEEVSPGARPSQSQEADVNVSSPGRIGVRIRGSDDYLKATFRLRRLGHHPTRFESQSTTDCASYSDGEIHRFLDKHKCISLNRTFIEIGEKDYEIQFSIATIEMPNYIIASDLHELLLRYGTGDITPLFPQHGRYRHISVTPVPSQTTLHDRAVINIQAQGLGRTPGAALISSLATSVLFSLDTM
jgi:hypothetical protein